MAASSIGLEADAASIRNFEPIVVPGLLQTADYARETFRTRCRRRADLRLVGDVCGTVPRPDAPVGESAAFFRLGRPQLLQLLRVGADLLGEGKEHLKDVGKFLRIIVGCEELGYLFSQLLTQPRRVLLGTSDVDDGFLAIGPDDLRDPIAHELAPAQRVPPAVCVPYDPAISTDSGIVDAQGLRIPDNTPTRAGNPWNSFPTWMFYLDHAMCSCNASDDNPYCSLASLESPQAQPCLAGSAALRGGSVRHTDWEQLEEPVRLAIEARTGRVRAARTVSAGLNSQLATGRSQSTP